MSIPAPNPTERVMNFVRMMKIASKIAPDLVDKTLRNIAPILFPLIMRAIDQRNHELLEQGRRRLAKQWRSTRRKVARRKMRAAARRRPQHRRIKSP